MADNTTLNTGTGGDVIATDDISGVKYQRVKIVLGADGINAGDVSSSNAMPISDNGGSITVDGSVTVSGTVTANAGTGTLNVSVQNASIPVTGTFWQATQPVSGTITANAGTGTMNVSVQNASIPVTDNAGSLTVDNSGTFAVQAAQSGTWTLGANSGVDIGDVTINNADISPIPSKIGDGTNYLIVDTVHNDAESTTENHLDVASKIMIYNGSTWDRTRGDITNGIDVDVTRVSGNVSVIGTASTPVPVQITNTSRTELRFYAVAAAAGTTGTETAITLTRSSGTSATTTATSFIITNGKRFKINQLIFATRGNATATIQSTIFNFRINTAGAVTTTSTPIILSARSATPATASAWDRNTITLPGDGIELIGDGTLQFGITAAATYTTNAPTWDVVLIGYEY